MICNAWGVINVIIVRNQPYFRIRQVLYLIMNATWLITVCALLCKYHHWIYRQISDISRTIVGNKIVNHSDVVGASSVGASPAISSFSTKYLASMDWAKTTARQTARKTSASGSEPCRQNYTSSHKKQPRPLTDARVNFERPERVKCMPQRYLCTNFDKKYQTIAGVRGHEINMICKKKCLFSPRALVRGIPARIDFAPES